MWILFSKTFLKYMCSNLLSLKISFRVYRNNGTYVFEVSELNTVLEFLLIDLYVLICSYNVLICSYMFLYVLICSYFVVGFNAVCWFSHLPHLYSHRLHHQQEVWFPVRRKDQPIKKHSSHREVCCHLSLCADSRYDRTRGTFTHHTTILIWL